MHNPSVECRICNRKIRWFDDIPLTGFCWGTDEKKHKEYKIIVIPYNKKEEGTKEAILVTCDKESILEEQICFVKEDWEQYMGPYCDLVPFSVGSNQYILELEE